MGFIEVCGLRKHFIKGGKEIVVLKGIDLIVARGEKLAIMGASGVGKSTLLHILGALERPTAGRVIYDGMDLSTLDDKALADFRNRQIGFVFQFHHLLPEFSALENAMIPALIQRVSRSEARRRAEEILVEVGMKERLSHRPGELSGGEQQRVAIARALVANPELLLADEPTGNLDRKTGEKIVALLMDLNERKGITQILATHNLELANRMPRKIRLVDGVAVEVQE